MQRRGFVKLCATAVAGVSASPQLLAEGQQELFDRQQGAVLLVNPAVSNIAGLVP